MHESIKFTFSILIPHIGILEPSYQRCDLLVKCIEINEYVLKYHENLIATNRSLDVEVNEIR